MMPCRRTPAPPLLAEHGDRYGRQYAALRQKRLGEKRRAPEFKWPKVRGASLYDEARHALADMTRGRCAYCDDYPASPRCIDHFQPKSWPEFHALVCSWSNLFLTCAACNMAKGERWTAALLRPDAEDYSFSRYFFYEAASGTLVPHPAASTDDQARARQTIEILDLNREDKRTVRVRFAKALLHLPHEELGDYGDRYLLSLVRGGES